MRLFWPSSTLALLVAVSTPALAEEGGTSDYPGVAPGRPQEPPSAQAIKAAKTRQMTWPGFQMRTDGGSRVFVQVSDAPVFTVRREGDRWVVLLKDTGIHLRTNGLPLETQFFPTPVQRVRIERLKKDLALIVELRTDATPEVRTEAAGNGYHYVIVDFAPIPGEAPPRPTAAPVAAETPSPRRTEAKASGSASTGRKSGRQQATDDERPPGFRATLRTR